MDIITLVLANIRHKKGTFAGIMIFMLIISLSVTSIVSLKRNFAASIESAYDHVNSGNIALNICRSYLTDDILDEVKTHPLVKDVIVSDTLITDRYILPDGSDGSFSLFISGQGDIPDRLWKADLSGFEDEVPVLGKGEIYLPQAMSRNENISVGESITAV
ncbi:MAG: hypothetical protein ILP19_01000, partial [Oscillospiraceae bacterium]|nr:hypothetical protein [Oscillospiraceae bacterium]